jgi:peptidoglycan-N-acetylglucosamine deacetylase
LPDILIPVPPKKHRVPWLLVLAAVLLVGALALAVLAFQQPINVNIDGRSESVKSGTTVADLAASGALQSKRGRLMSVTGTVLQLEGGAQPLVWRNGELVAPTARLFEGDKIVSATGVDEVEKRASVKEPIPYKTKTRGSGPVMRLTNPGSVGIRETVIGAVSKTVVSSGTVRPAQDMVITRTRPTPKDKLVALTFDDGPWPGQTDKILKILRHEGVHATFFMLGVRVKIAPKLAKQVADDGNLIGSHSLGHRLLTKAKAKEIKRQIVGGTSAIKKATGVKATWFRPPYGAINERVWKQTRNLHLRVAMWDVDTMDWSAPGVKKIVKTAQTRTRKGSIILMHDGGGTRTQTIKALPKIIRSLKKRGFIFVTMRELDAAN